MHVHQTTKTTDLAAEHLGDNTGTSCSLTCDNVTVCACVCVFAMGRPYINGLPTWQGEGGERLWRVEAELVVESERPS